MSLKKYLSQFTKEQLIAQILELNKKYKDVKAYYDFSLAPDISAEKEKAKSSVYKCFFPTWGDKLRLKDAKKVISDFKKLDPNAASFADVMMYYVECGVKITNMCDDMDVPFYNSIGGMFKDAAKLIIENEQKKTLWQGQKK